MVDTVMCAVRLPAVLVAKIDAAAKELGVIQAQHLAEACRMRLDDSTKSRGSSVVEHRLISRLTLV